jgi:hypothetical protein
LLSEARVVPEDHSEEHCAAFAVEPVGNGHAKLATEPVREAPEATAVSDDPPPVAGEDDVDSSPPKRLSLVEPVQRPAGELRLGAHLEHPSERRRSPERQFELRRLVERAQAEPADLDRHRKVEAPPPRRGRYDDKRPLRAADLAAKDAVIEPFEPRTAPPPTPQREQARRRGDAAPRRRSGDRRGGGESGQSGLGREPNEIRERDSHAQRTK